MNHFIIDFDSTFVKLEALDELADIALADHPKRDTIVEEIRQTTQLGMEGKITFPESLGRRFKLLSAKRSHIDQLIKKLKENVSDSIKSHQEYFRRNNDRLYIISGGFEEYILPVVSDYGICPEHILANRFVFDRQDNIIGFDQNRFLAQEQGKVKQVRALDLAGEVWVVGDGYTDYQIKEQGAAHKFIAFCENVTRASVTDKADTLAKDFTECLVHLAASDKNM